MNERNKLTNLSNFFSVLDSKIYNYLKLKIIQKV